MIKSYRMETILKLGCYPLPLWLQHIIAQLVLCIYMCVCVCVYTYVAKQSIHKWMA